MNDLCIDIDYSQLYKHGQKIGGDVFFLDRDEGSNMITAILSDGLGSGVRANVLASLTAHMASKMSLSPMDLEHSAEIIMDTLPVDSEKGISYSTFTIAKIIFSDNKSFIRIELVEYDNPDSLRFHDSERISWEKSEFRLKRKAAIKKEVVYSSSFEMKHGDRLIFFSDGVAQSGVSLGTIDTAAAAGAQHVDAAYAAFSQAQPAGRIQPSGNYQPVGRIQPSGTYRAAVRAQIYSTQQSSDRAQIAAAASASKEWGTENVAAFVQEVLRNDPEISARQLSREIVTEAYKHDNYKPNDDITCCVIGVRRPRRTLIVTGAPRNRESDKRLGELVKNYEGQVIVCGGTTAKIIARELGRDITADKSAAGSLPPSSCIEGIDLVTEGMLTLTEVAHRLSGKMLLRNMTEDAAKRMIKLLRETDQIEIVVGTKINDEIEDPSTAAKIGLRFPAIDEISRSLIHNYFKECEVLYI